jgi:streptogramin lyase
VDLLGNVWVANRAFGSQGTATKLANLPVDCIDRNGNGVIDTSTDWNANGVIDPDCNANGVFDTLTTACPGGAPPEFIGQDDECILFSVNVGGVDSVPRALSLTGGSGPGDSGDVWIGAYNDGAFYKFDGDTGVQLARVPPVGSAGVAPYGSVIDSNGTLWAVNECCTNGGIRPLNTVTNTFGAVEVKPASLAATVCGPGGGGGDPGQYGIAVDGENRIWLGGWPCNAAFMYDPATDAWTAVNAGNPGYGARGVAVDGFGQVWLAMHLDTFTGAKLVRIDGTALAVIDTFDLAPLAVDVPVGVGVAFDGSIWTVNQSSSSAVRLHIDPTTGDPTPHPVTGNLLDEFPVGLEPYTYSDFTGFGLRNFTAPQGTYTFTVEGCALGAPADWNTVTWSATTPPGTSVVVSVRAGDDLPTLPTEPSFGDWSASPAVLSLPPGPVPSTRYLEVTVQLVSMDQLNSPTVTNVAVQWNCTP